MTSKKLPEKTYELSLLCDEEKGFKIGILKKVLSSQGISPFEIVETHFGLVARLSIYFDALSEARRVKKKLSHLNIRGVRLAIKPLRRSHWQNLWKENFKPFWLTQKIKVIPAWLKKPSEKPSHHRIFIDTVNAFGTGLHETTRFMANLIEGYQGKFSRFLDIGTGTGILTFVALRCGATNVVAFDYDRYAVQAAKKNFILNGHSANFVSHADIYHVKSRPCYDFVAANLITLDLIKYRKQILSFVAMGGYLAVSGISLENLPLFQKRFIVPQLRLKKLVKGKQWAALLYQRKSPSQY